MRHSSLSHNPSSLNVEKPPASPTRNSDPIPLTKLINIQGNNLTAYRPNPSPEASERMSKVELCPWLRYKGDLTKINTSLSQISGEQPILKSGSSSSDKRQTLNLGGSDIMLYRFIVTVEGQLICATNNPDFEEFSHISIANRSNTEDAPYLLAAGELGFDHSGKLTFVSNRTGHYRIPSETLHTVLLPCLECHGYSVEDLQQLYVRPCSIEQPTGGEPAQFFLDYTSSSYTEYFNQKVGDTPTSIVPENNPPNELLPSDDSTTQHQHCSTQSLLRHRDNKENRPHRRQPTALFSSTGGSRATIPPPNFYSAFSSKRRGLFGGDEKFHDSKRSRANSSSLVGQDPLQLKNQI